MQLLGVLHNRVVRGAGRWSLAHMWRVWRAAVERGASERQLRRWFGSCLLDRYRRRANKSRRRAAQKKRRDRIGAPKLRRLTIDVKADWTKRFGWRTPYSI